MGAVKIIHPEEDGVDVALHKNGLGTRGQRKKRLAVELHDVGGMVMCVM